MGLKSFVKGVNGGILSAPGLLEEGWNKLKGNLDPYDNFKADAFQPDPEIAAMTKNWALTGEGPSAAQNMVAAERAKNMAAAQSQAKSQAGLGLAAQQRLATEGAAHANVGAAQQGAELRAQEQQLAMKNYQDMYDTQARAYADAMRANADVSAANASTRKGILGGMIEGVGNWLD